MSAAVPVQKLMQAFAVSWCLKGNSPLMSTMLSCNFTVELCKIELKRRKRKRKKKSVCQLSQMGSRKQQGKHHCLLLCPDADESFEAAVETGVKWMSRGYAKGSSAACLWMLFWASQRGISLTVTSAPYWQGQLFGLAMGFEEEHEAGSACKQVKGGTVMYLALKGTWTFLGLGHVRKREKQQWTESLLLGKCLVRRRQSLLCLLMCCQCIFDRLWGTQKGNLF